MTSCKFGGASRRTTVIISSPMLEMETELPSCVSSTADQEKLHDALETT